MLGFIVGYLYVIHGIIKFGVKRMQSSSNTEKSNKSSKPDWVTAKSRSAKKPVGHRQQGQKRVK